jgi:AcrR family transcriptional regulator
MARQRDYSKMDKIYEATLDLITKKGFSGLKMAEVAESSGVAIGTIYIYFKDKDDLINHLYAHINRQKTSVFSDIGSDHQPFEELFRTLWFRYFDANLKQIEEAVFMEQYYHSSFLKNANQEDSRQFLQPVFDVFEKGKKAGKLKNVSNEILFAVLSGSVHELIRLHQTGLIKITPQVKEATFLVCWSGMGA